MASSVGRDLLITAAGQVMAALQGLIVLPIVIRFAGAGTYGAYVLLTNFVTVVFSLFASVVTYRYRRGLVSVSSFEERRRLFEPQFTFQIVALGLTSGLLLLASADIKRAFFADAASFASWLLVVLLFSQLVSRQVQDYLQYTQRFLPFSLASGSTPYVFVTGLVLIAATGGSLSLDELLMLQVATTLCVSVPVLPIMLRELGFPRLSLPVRTLIADARVGLPLTLELLIDFLLRYSDRYLIVLFMSVADVGRYQPAYTLASVVILLIGMTETVLIPAVSKMVDMDQRADAERLVASFLRLFLMIAIPFVVGTLMVGPTLLALLTTPEIGVASRWVAPLVALGSIFYGVMRFGSLVAYVLGRTRTILGANAIGAGLNVALNIIVLPALRDITVPAVTTSLGYAASSIYVTLALRSVWRIHVEPPVVLRFFAATAVMGGFLFALGYRPAVVVAASAMALIEAALVGIVVYFVALAALGGLGRREILEFFSLIRRRAAPVE